MKNSKLDRPKNIRTSPPLTTNIDEIDSLDLSPIRYRLKNDEKWDNNLLDKAEDGYRAFLFLVLKYPDHTIVPDKKIDTFWHYHILDTEKYEKDCFAIFNKILHHFPYFGLRGEADRNKLISETAKTKDLFFKEFPNLDLYSDVVLMGCSMGPLK